MRMIYVSNTGNDSNDGLSKTTPWATLAKVNADSLSGDIVHFKCGDTFYGNLIPKAGTINNVTVTKSYGEGDRPIISPYKKVTATASWVDQGSNVWRLDLSDITKYSGNQVLMNYNVGFLRVDSVIYGYKQSTNSLDAQWEFYSDAAQYLYVYSVGNPNSVATEIMVAVQGHVVTSKNYLSVLGLEMVGSGSHGIALTTSGLTVSNCFIHEIGGSYLSGTTRYGNGVELWVGTSDAKITHNIISDCYDTATTMQGDSAGGFVNCVFKYNTIYNCTQAFEWWDGGGTGYTNCSFEDNICINAGSGWGYDTRPFKTAGCAILVYANSSPVGLKVRGNIFYNPLKFMHVDITVTLPISYISDYNYIFMKESNILSYHEPLSFTMAQYKDFITNTGMELHSQFHFLEDYAPTNSLVKIMNFLASVLAETSIYKNSINSSVESLRTVTARVDSLQLASSYLSGSTTPIGAIVPDFVRQEYLETTSNPKVWYKSTGLTNADWVALN